MQITQKQLIDLIETAGFPVYRDLAPTDAVYPYVRYQFVDETMKRSSNGVAKYFPQYQISLFTKGIETDMYKITDILNKNKIPHSQIDGIPGSENDDLVTHFFIYVRCIR
ncbi:hypothetical protein [Macrococcoides canis]|uniref:hypothetical protein n=1 Tax=Macrococcoides canis TaxID=1855823 RepID=UPI0020B76201|nr:hypothetical protein [Macrococcus canis]UTG99324.1 hypothetical protein KFV04_07370 [Macrococcus canis]